MSVCVQSRGGRSRHRAERAGLCARDQGRARPRSDILAPAFNHPLQRIPTLPPTSQMLSRSQRNPVLSEENAVHSRAGPSHFTKTPARQGGPLKSAGLTTGGKGMLTTNKSSRVLGQKDANAGRTPAPGKLIHEVITFSFRCRLSDPTSTNLYPVLPVQYT